MESNTRTITISATVGREGRPVKVNINPEGVLHISIDGKDVNPAAKKPRDPETKRRIDNACDGLYDWPSFSDGKIISSCGPVTVWQEAAPADFIPLKIFESYGVLTHEKRPVYSVGRPASDAYNAVSVLISNADNTIQLFENEAGEKLITIGGTTYLLSEVLTNYGDKPCLSWFNSNGRHRIMLEVID